MRTLTSTGSRSSGEFDGPATVSVCAADRRGAGGASLPTVQAVTVTSPWDIRYRAGDRGSGSRSRPAARARPSAMGAWLANDADTATATVCITTHNRGVDCVERARSVSPPTTMRSASWCGSSSSIKVIAPVRDAPGFEAAAAALGERLKVDRAAQPRRIGWIQPRHDRVARRARDPRTAARRRCAARAGVDPAHARVRVPSLGETIVGAHMLSLTDRTLLHSVGERIARRGFWWTSVESSLAPWTSRSRRSTPPRRFAADTMSTSTAGGCASCRSASVRRVGASLPLFIKWDDAEFGLRAAAAGVPTVTLPGAALWHMPWTGQGRRTRLAGLLPVAQPHRRRPDPLRLTREAAECSPRHSRRT